MPQHKKEVIDDGKRSKLDCRLVLTIVYICKFFVFEVEQWLDQKPCSFLTNTENIAARNEGGGQYSKASPSKAMFCRTVGQYCLRDDRGNDELLVN